ncbi:MAG: ribose-phosphate diphosphokinase [Halolamina sp.]
MIVPGSTSQALAGALSAATGRPLARATYDRFPDGETLASVSGFDGDEAVVVAATTSNDAYVELLQLQDAVREAGAERVTTVLPYMGYSRQDRAFKRGHPVSARAMARAVSTGTDRVVLVTPHEPTVADFFEVPCEVVDAASLLADPLPADLTDPLFLSPDQGAVELARTVRDGYGRGGADYFEKRRDYDSGEVTVDDGGAGALGDGRDVVLTDDMIATGSTMSEAVAHLRAAADPAGVYVACVHPLLVADARTKLEAAGLDGIWGTDTVECDVSAVSVAPLVADAL